MRLHRVFALGLVGVACFCAPGVERACASCAAPTRCEIDEVEVLSCALADPEKDEQIQRFVESMRKIHNSELARRVQESYRGVFVEVQQTSTHMFDCKRGLDPKLYDESAYKLSDGSLAPSEAVRAGRHRWFFQTRDAKACGKRFPPKRALRMRAASACCDGDPNAPCLLGRD